MHLYIRSTLLMSFMLSIFCICHYFHISHRLYKYCKKQFLGSRPRSSDPFEDYEWLPNYKQDYGNSCEIHNIPLQSNQGKCYLILDTKTLLSLKLELFSEDPLVLLLHSVLNDEYIEKIIEDTENDLEESQVLAGVDLEASMLDPSRVARSAWVYNDNENLNEIKWLFTQLTGIDLSRAEAMNVINYSPGGHYAPHYDSLNVSEDLPHEDGDRTLTLLTFLNEPELGGETVFPLLNFAVKPEKGSVLLWFNLMVNGVQDPSTLHGGCPVWEGTKQIGTIWVRQRENEIVIKCTNSWLFGVDSFQNGLIRLIDYML